MSNASQSYVYGSGVTNIPVDSFELGVDYSKYDIVFFSGYTDGGTEYFPAVTGQYYYSGDTAATSTAANSPAITI